MKWQVLYSNNRGKYCLYALCFSLIFLLSLAYSSIIMAQDPIWQNPQNLLSLDWVYNLDVSLFSNLGIPSAPVLAIDQGRSGFQAQAPEGIQVLSARSKHVLYSFWARPAQNQWEQGYYPVYLNEYQQGPYQPSTNPLYPLFPFYDEPYWHTAAALPSPIGPSMFYAEPYWSGLGGGFGAPLSSIGPSMFYGEPYWHQSLSGSLPMNL